MRGIWIATFIIIEVSTLCLSQTENLKLKVMPEESAMSLDNLIKKPICQFFSRIDKYFSDFIEGKIPYFEEKTKILDNGLTTVAGGLNGISTGEMHDKMDTSLTHLDSGSSKEEFKWPINFFQSTADIRHKLHNDHNPLLSSMMSLHRSRRRRVAGDEPAKDDYPIVVRVCHDGVYKMTGVILADNLVATSASGLLDNNGHLMKSHHLAILSTPEPKSSNGKSYEHKVKDIYLMPQFKNKSNSSTHDLALLKLETPVNVGYYLPILPKTVAALVDSSVPVKCTVLTWKKINQIPETSDVKYELKKVFINLSEESKCKQQLENFDEQTEYCATETISGANQGSPLICNGNLIGIVSHSSGNSSHHQFEVFTKLTAFHDFIKNVQLNLVPPMTSQNLAKELGSSVTKPMISHITFFFTLISTISNFLMNY